MTWDPRTLDSEWPFDIMSTDFPIGEDRVALLVIDMQSDQIAMAPDSTLATRCPEIASYWNQRINETVIPNIQCLTNFFRETNREIVYTRNGNVTSTAAEMTERLKRKLPDKESLSNRNSLGYQIDKRLTPRDVDLVVDKLTSGSFTASLLDHALRNMGIRTVILSGVLTDACVFGTARAAAEIGYNTLVCEDACATFTQRAHDEALLMHARIFGRVETTDGVLAELTE